MRKALKYTGTGLLILIVCLVIVIGQYLISANLNKKTPERIKDLITSNPLNLSQIESISKFRSCQGHNFPGYNFEGQYESNRSLKHYIIARQSFQNSTGKVEAYAPFDGVIESAIPENRGKQTKIQSETSEWVFIFFHLDLVEGVEVGTSVKSGQLLGYANIPDGTNFDMGLQYGLDNSILAFITSDILQFGDPSFFEIFDSPFNYMKDEILEEYEDVGIVASATAYSKEYRDSNPCDFNNESKFRDEDFIELVK